MQPSICKPSRGACLAILAAFTGSCVNAKESSDPTVFKGYLTMRASGIWNNDTGSGCNVGYESGAESASLTCFLNGSGGGSVSGELRMQDVLTTYDNCNVSRSINDYDGTMSSSDVSSCTPSLDVKTGAWTVGMDPSIQWVGSGTTQADGVITPLVLSPDEAAVFVTAVQQISGTGQTGCVPIEGSLTVQSGDAIGAAARTLNARAVPMTFSWYFAPQDCGGSTGFADGGPDAGLGFLSCAEIYDCFQGCPAAGHDAGLVEACESQCFIGGTADAGADYLALEQCYDAACLAADDGGMPPCAIPSSSDCATCISTACPSLLSTCLAN